MKKNCVLDFGAWLLFERTDVRWQAAVERWNIHGDVACVSMMDLLAHTPCSSLLVEGLLSGGVTGAIYGLSLWTWKLADGIVVVEGTRRQHVTHP